jgi:hypothetical protein
MATIKINNVTVISESGGTTSLILNPGTAPGSPVEGQMYYDTTTKVVSIYNGTSWIGLSNIATGGTITSYPGYIVHTFLTSGTFTPTYAGTVDYLVVAGGGGGGNARGSNWGSAGGAGAGGFRTASGLAVTAQSYTIIIGQGGAGGPDSTSDSAVNGEDSSALGITSTGGGKGGSGNYDGTAGGSGGGGGYNNKAGGAGNYPNTSPSQGYGGGAGTNTQSSGGGGGAGAIGQAGQSTTQGGAGGVGEDEVMGLNAADSYTLLTNANVGHVVSGARYFAGGGGGGTYSAGTGGSGGYGGGGAGGNPPGAGTNATANTGGGGGGASATALPSPTGGAGGSGIVIIRYAV